MASFLSSCLSTLVDPTHVVTFLRGQLNPLNDFSQWITLAIVVLQIAVTYFLINWGKTFFEDEYTRIPEFSFEVPKPAGGFMKEGETKLDPNCSTFPCYNPATLEILGTAKAMKANDVVSKVASARKAQKEWAKTSFAERRRVLRSLMNYLVKHQAEMSEISIRETGKTAIDSAFGEIFMSCEKTKYIINNGEKYLSREYRDPGLLMKHKSAYIEYIPCGVIGLIIPWNFPVHNVLSHITTALFAGNAAVIKVSEWASWSSIYMERLLHSWLKANGHSTDLIQFVTGFAEAGTSLVTAVDKVLFIGSPGVGKKVMEAASTSLTPVTLELGGKDPFIVCDDADVDYAVNMALRGAFLNCGQNCLSAERFYVYDKVYDIFLKKVLETLPKIKQGPSPSSDVGAINMPAQIPRYVQVLEDAVSKGAKILAGGKVNSTHKGHFFEPTVIVNVNHTMNLMREEMFGPVMSVMRVHSDEEVVKLANDCNYGLGCSIFSSDYARALKIGKQIEAGTTVVNDWGLSMLIQSLPFGGVKVSGFGKFNGPEGIRDFTFQKCYVTDKFGFKMPPPAALFYPSPQRVHTLVEDFVVILYGNGLAAKAKAAGSLVKKIVTRDYL